MIAGTKHKTLEAHGEEPETLPRCIATIDALVPTYLLLLDGNRSSEHLSATGQATTRVALVTQFSRAYR